LGAATAYYDHDYLRAGFWKGSRYFDGKRAASAIVLWNLFNDAFTGTSAIFSDNAHIFSKVYFPRLVMPVARLIGYLISFSIQFTFFLLVLGYYLLFTTWHMLPTVGLPLVLLVIVLVSIQSLALGLLFSVLTGKYRDIRFDWVCGY
jgi:lipopolysaccharide transport system permease protein